jgi:pyruvate ferredoxin oxidoreductase gamma subunit
MIELLFYGRAGEGGKTAAELIADASLEEGKYIQCFPEYGPEREGAPVKAFTRVDSKPIRVHCNIKSPGTAIIINPTLLDCGDVLDIIKKDGVLVVNTEKSPEEIRKETGFKGKIATVNATKISIDAFGRSIPNMPMLGALLKATDVVKMESLKKHVFCRFYEKIGEEKTKKNMSVIDTAYDEVRIDG